MLKRILRFTHTVETVVARLETTSRLLHAVGRNTTRPDEIYEEIGILTQDLTRVGLALEAAYPGKHKTTEYLRFHTEIEGIC